MLIYIFLCSIILSGIVAIILMNRRMKKNRGKKNKARRQQNQIFSLARYGKFNKFFDNFFLSRKEYKATKEKLANLSIYTPVGIEVQTVNAMLKSYATFTAFMLVGIFLFRDVFTIVLMLLYAYVMKDVFVFKQLDKAQYKVLNALSIALSNVSQAYMRTGNIPDSVRDANVDSSLQGAFSSVYTILTSRDQETKLEEFSATTPFRILQTFASACFIVNDSGDTKGEDGSSNFIEAMSMMADEVNLEIRKITLTKAEFGLLEILPVAPILALGIIENFFLSIMPGVSVIYKGVYGYTLRVVILLASLISYLIITKVNSTEVVAKDDRNILCTKLLKYKWFKKIVTDIKPKRGERLKKKLDLLKGALSCKNLEHVYGLKIIFSVILLVGSIVTALICVDLGKDFAYNNYAQTGLFSGEDLTAEDIVIRKKMDTELLRMNKEPTDSQLETLVKKYYPRLDDYNLPEQTERLSSKWSMYKTAYFKWWMLLVSIGLATVGWFVPDFMMKARVWLIATESEEDILQLQTIIAILMHTNNDTLNTLLWMSRQSRIYKNALLEAYHNYPSDPDMALERLKRSSPSAEFHRMVDNLKLTISQITLLEAFHDLGTQRGHTLRVREIKQIASIKKKRAKVSPVSMAPLFLTIAFYIVVPICYLGIKGFMKSMSGF